MSTPDIAARLLLASDEAMAPEARDLAEQLNSENLRRQHEEAEIVAAARKVVETDLEVGSRTVIVVAGEGWHRGVIGIVASKLVDAFHRPAIVLSVDGDVAHGSCRSIPSFNMLAALESCADAMLKFGGHKQAAGLTIEAARIRELRARVNAHADGCLGPDDLRPRLWIDGALDVSLDQRAGHLRADDAGAVRGRESVPGVPRQPRGSHRRPAPGQRSPPEDGVQAGRPCACAASRGAPVSARASWRSIGRRSISRFRLSRTPGTASATCSSRSPISGRPRQQLFPSAPSRSGSPRPHWTFSLRRPIHLLPAADSGVFRPSPETPDILTNSMTLWQRRARIGVAAFGITCAVVVYFALRRTAACRRGCGRSRRSLPGVVQQTRDGSEEQFSGRRQDGVVGPRSALPSMTDSTKHTEVKIIAQNRDGRDFVVTAARRSRHQGQSRHGADPVTSGCGTATDSSS